MLLHEINILTKLSSFTCVTLVHLLGICYVTVTSHLSTLHVNLEFGVGGIFTKFENH